MLNSPIYVTRVTLPPIEQYHQLLSEIWESGQVTNNGPKVRQLEQRLADRFGVDTCHYVTNGTVALQLAFRALGLAGEVITTPYSYVATTNALLYENLTPVFADVEPEYFTLDPAKVEAVITERTTAIVATHVYGYPCRHAELRAIAEAHGLRLIYDAAHAFGTRVGGESVMHWGDVSTLSFHATKLFHTIEGGGVTCADPAVAERVSLLRSFGHVDRDYLQVGVNGKNSELHAAVGLLNLPHVSRRIAARRRISDRYRAAFAKTNLRCLCPEGWAGLHYNYAYFPVVCDSLEQREAIVEKLAANNVFPRRYFEPSLNELPFLDEPLKTSCPVSERAARTVLCLPLYEDLSDADQDRVLRGTLAALEIPVA